MKVGREIIAGTIGGMLLLGLVVGCTDTPPLTTTTQPQPAATPQPTLTPAHSPGEDWQQVRTNAPIELAAAVRTYTNCRLSVDTLAIQPDNIAHLESELQAALRNVEQAEQTHRDGDQIGDTGPTWDRVMDARNRAGQLRTRIGDLNQWTGDEWQTLLYTAAAIEEQSWRLVAEQDQARDASFWVSRLDRRSGAHASSPPPCWKLPFTNPDYTAEQLQAEAARKS